MYPVTLKDDDPYRHNSLVKSIGKYHEGDILVSTAYNASTGGYDTIVMHPYYNNEIVLVESYTNEIEADAGHAHWCMRTNNNSLPPRVLVDPKAKLSKRKVEYKISLYALMKILLPFSIWGNQLKATRLQNKQGHILLTIVKGDRKGALVYDSNNNVASNVTAGWGTEIQKQIDHALDKYLNEGIEEEMEEEQRQIESLQHLAGIDQAGIPY
jgi:hypothetical protein